MINTDGFFFVFFLLFFIHLGARFEAEKTKKKQMLHVTNEWMKGTLAKFRLEVCGPKKAQASI